MFRKMLIALFVFLVLGAASFGSVYLAEPDQVSLPQAITTESPCPVAGCTASECHAAEPAPQPDGTFEMTCPETTSCSSSQCHAWEALTSHYKAPIDWAMNVWILAPVLFVIGLVFIVRKL